MEVSHLQVKVTSEGIDKVSRQLGGLGNSANNAEVKVGKLTDTISKLIGMQGKLGSVQQAATTHAQNQANVFGNLHTVMGQVAANMNAMTAAMTGLMAGLQGVTAQANNSASAFQRKSHWGNVATSTLKAMATAAVTYAGLNLAKNVVESADAWQLMNAKLQVATKSQHNANRAQQDIYETAQKTRTPLEATAQLWTRLVAPMQRMGKTGEDVTRVVQSVSTAMKLSGATAAEQSSAMLQLSQSFNAGRLNGAEFNAVAEAAPLILDAIATQMGKTRAQLKKLGSDGQITGDVLVAALTKIGPTWDKQFATLPITFGDAMTVLKNRWEKEIGEMGADTKFNQELVKAVKTVEDLIPLVARGLGEAFVSVMQWVRENGSALQQIWEQVVGIGKDVWNIVTGFFGWIGSIREAEKGTSVIAAGLFGVRLVLAGIVDIVKMVSASIINVGADIYEFFLMPISLVVKAIKLITEGLAAVSRASASMSSFFGDNETAAKDEQRAKALEDFGNGVEETFMKAITLGQKARDVADDLTEGFRNGTTQVEKLLAGTSKLPSGETSKPKLPYEGAMAGGKGEGALPDEKALKKAQHELEKYQKAFESLNDKIKEQIELNGRLNKFGLDYDKMSTGAKERIKWESELQRLEQEGASKSQKDRAFILLLQAKELEAYQAMNEQKLEALRLDKAEEDASKSKLKTLEDEAAQWEYKAATFNMAKGAIEALELATAKQAQTELLAMETITPHQVKMLELLNAQIAARERIAKASGDVGQLETSTALDKMLDGNKAAKFGNDFKEAFGKAGKAVGTVADALEKMNQRQVKTNKMRDEYNKLTVKDAKSAEQLARIQDQEGRDAIDTYADMASAAKGFFDEKSKGYAAMEAAEKTFRAFQMAMAIKQFVQESGLITALSTIFLGAKTAEATAEVASVGVNATANATKQTANATTAATSALAAPWPASFASFAIVIGLLAALGVGLSGGGSAPSAPASNQGTGTVLGDSSAKSTSIADSLDSLSDIDRMTMRYSAAMARSLENIEASLGGLTNLILRDTTGLSSGKNLGVNEGVIKSSGDPLLNATEFLGGGKALNQLAVALDMGGLIGKLQSLWGKTTTEIVAAGLNIQGTLAQLQSGQGYSQFADVKTTSSSFFGLKKDTDFQTIFGKMDPALANQFGKVLTNMVDAVTTSAEQLGKPLSSIQAALANFTLSIGKIDLKGLTGDQIQEKLAAVFGAAGDQIAQAVIPGFEAFQRAGEGYLETIIRTASGVEQASYELDKLGIAAINISDVINKQGDVGGEIVRQSIMLQEAGTGVGEIISVISGTAADVADAYKTLTSLRRALKDVGLGDNLNADIIKAAGGLSALQDAVASYTDNFFSDAEKQAMKVGQLTDSFAKLGLALPASKDAFRALIDSLKAGGQDTLATQVLLLADSFASLSDAATQAAQEAVTTARDSLSQSYEREKSALEDVKSRFEDFASSLHDFKSSLLTGDLSTLTSSEKYGELKSQYETTRAAAMGGDETAISKFQSIAQEFLSFSREFNASGEQYMTDFNAVLAATTALEDFTKGRASEAEQQITLLTQQVQGLLDLNTSVLSVQQAIIDLQVALAGASSLTPAAADANATVEALAYQADDQAITREQAMDALVEEVKALRTEVTALRQQQAGETAALIGANYDANELAASTVAAATTNAASVSSYTERVPSTIV